ncbi:MAG: hypothetical protein LBU56_00780 [Rickettsiales bacterium]|nr:hypothetical protein [Rickettsiales bacterium]
MYNAVKKLKDLFSDDAEIVRRSYWTNFIKQIPFIREIAPTKQEPIKEFMKRMEKEGKDGLTKYGRYFVKIKKHNEQYRPKLFLASYKPPVPISDNDL